MPNSYRVVLSIIVSTSLVILSPGSSQALDRNFTTVTVANTTTATSIYSYVVPANLLSTARGVHVYLWGTYRQQSGNNRTLTVRVNFGGVTLLQDNSSNVVDSNATTGQFTMEVVLMNAGATDAQRGSFRFVWDRGAGTPTFLEMVATSTSGTVDTTADQTLDITVQHSNANAAITLSRTGALTTLL